jgi:hypothetical protein
MDIFVGCIHFPYQHEKAVNEFLSFLREHKKEISNIYLLGDIIDFHTISHHPQTLSSPLPIENELNMTKDFLSEIRGFFKREMHYILGNHEQRLVKYLLNDGSKLKGLPELSFRHLMDLDRLKIKLHEKYMLAGEWMLLHGETVRAFSAYSAKAAFDKYHRNIIMAHTHRQGIYLHTIMGKTYMAIETGTLQDISKQNYANNPNWQMGWLVLESNKPILVTL